MTTPFVNLKAVVLDWAGTTIDFGSCAPAAVFREVFQRRGVPISDTQAREPMGKAKREHIASIAAIPAVASAWQVRYGTPCAPSDIDAMYEDFLPLQKKILHKYCQLIPGVPELARTLRTRGLKIGSSTGYTRELMEIVTAAASEQGYQADCVLAAEDAPQGRPAPFLLYEAARRLGVYPMWHVVKVDDTPVGVQAGRNAGCWSIGVSRTGNGVGLSSDQLATMPLDQQQQRIESANQSLCDAGAHAVVESVADIVPVLEDFDRRLTDGQLPMA